MSMPWYSNLLINDFYAYIIKAGYKEYVTFKKCVL